MDVCFSMSLSECITAKANYEEIPGRAAGWQECVFRPMKRAIFWPNELPKAAFFRLSSRNSELHICAGSDFSEVLWVCCPVSFLPMQFWCYAGRHFFSVQREFKKVPNCGRGLSRLLNQLRVIAIMHLNVRLAT